MKYEFKQEVRPLAGKVHMAPDHASEIKPGSQHLTEATFSPRGARSCLIDRCGTNGEIFAFVWMRAKAASLPKTRSPERSVQVDRCTCARMRSILCDQMREKKNLSAQTKAPDADPPASFYSLILRDRSMNIRSEPPDKVERPTTHSRHKVSCNPRCC